MSVEIVSLEEAMESLLDIYLDKNDPVEKTKRPTTACVTVPAKFPSTR